MYKRQYEIRDPADDKLKQVHVDKLHTYHMGPNEDVQDTIAMDEFENLVEEIVDHRRVKDSSSGKDIDYSCDSRKRPQDDSAPGG